MRLTDYPGFMSGESKEQFEARQNQFREFERAEEKRRRFQAKKSYWVRSQPGPWVFGWSSGYWMGATWTGIARIFHFGPWELHVRERRKG